MTVPRIAMIMVLGAWTGCLDSSSGVKAVDVPASQLTIEPTIDDEDSAPADGKVPVVVQFFEGNEFVKFSSATLTINGVVVPYGSMGYAARVPIVAAGNSMTFTYIRAGTTTQFNYRVPPRPTVTSPTTNQVVARSANLVITYVSANGQAVRPLASDTSLGATGVDQTDTGMAFIDVTGLRSGAGTVGVVRRYVTTPPGSGFQSAAVTYAIASVPTPVSWQ